MGYYLDISWDRLQPTACVTSQAKLGKSFHSVHLTKESSLERKEEEKMGTVGDPLLISHFGLRHPLPANFPFRILCLHHQTSKQTPSADPQSHASILVITRLIVTLPPSIRGPGLPGLLYQILNFDLANQSARVSSR